MKRDTLIGQYSPWGQIQHVTRYGDDIAFVSTSSHGGFRVTGDSLGTLRALHSDWEPFLQQPKDIGWYEEDCDAPVVVLCLGGMFPAENLVNSAGYVAGNPRYYSDRLTSMAKMVLRAAAVEA